MTASDKPAPQGQDKGARWPSRPADDANTQGWRELALHYASSLQAMREELAALKVILACAQDGERRERLRAEHDSLTALPNRTGFDRRLSSALHAQPPGDATPQRTLAVLFLDLDHFKRVNDSHGHAVGDALLRVVGQRLQLAVRAGDIVCRLGGDEFACLLEGPVNRDELTALAGKLIDAVSAPLQLGELQLSVRPSVGIAISPCDGSSAAELLARADAAMFHAKRQRTGLAFCGELA